MRRAGRRARRGGVLAALRRLLRQEDGAATIEFTILFSVAFLFVANCVETGIVLSRGALLDRALDIAVRDLRLGTAAPPTFEAFRGRICENAVLMPDCMKVLQVQLVPRAGVGAGRAQSFEALDRDRRCVNRAAPLTPLVEASDWRLLPNAQNTMVIVRACAVFDPMFAGFGLGAALPKDPTGGYFVSAAAAYVSEP